MTGAVFFVAWEGKYTLWQGMRAENTVVTICSHPVHNRAAPVYILVILIKLPSDVIQP